MQLNKMLNLNLQDVMNVINVVGLEIISQW